MTYKIVFDTSADKNSAVRKYIVVASNNLPQKIANLQVAGRIIVSVTQSQQHPTAS